MISPIETIISTLPASSQHDRVLVVMVCATGEPSRLELRQQSFSEGIGWFTQSSVQLETNQVADLKNALGTAAPARRLPREFSTLAPRTWQPRLVQADSA